MTEQDLLIPAYKDGYSVMFGTQYFFLVFKMLATIYERLVKAKQLIQAKVEDDLANRELLEVISLTADDEETKTKLEAFKASASRERFSMMVSAVISNMAVAQKLDSSNYEDIARLYMGSEAYLMFHFDKLIVQVS